MKPQWNSDNDFNKSGLNIEAEEFMNWWPFVWLANVRRAWWMNW